MGDTSYEVIENMEEVADLHSPDVVLIEKESEALGEEKKNAEESGKPYEAAPGVVLFKNDCMIKHFFEFVDFCSKHPEEWQVLKIKMRNPDLSARELGELCSISKRMVFYRLEKIRAYIDIKNCRSEDMPDKESK